MEKKHFSTRKLRRSEKSQLRIDFHRLSSDSTFAKLGNSRFNKTEEKNLIEQPKKNRLIVK